MISEKQIHQQMFKSDINGKNNIDDVSMEFTPSTEFGKMKEAFHQKIRNRQLDKIKAEKRKQHEINVAIENVLQSNFPKESCQAKEWANYLNELYQKSANYQTDPHKLREIFYFAQRFPSLGTLRLFYFAVLTAENKNIKTLADVDVWTFLHMILKDSAQAPISPLTFASNSQVTPLSSGSHGLSINETQLEMVKLVINIFVLMFEKELTMRDYSIGIHCTYTKYLRHSYRKFGDNIRTELILFLFASLKQPPKQYKKDYLCLIRLAIGMINEYNIKVELFMEKKEWIFEEMGETIQEAITRIGILFNLVSKSFEHALTKWIIEFLDPKNSTINFNYFENTNQFLTFGLWVLGQLVSSKDDSENFYDTFGKTMEMMFNSFYFFIVMTEKVQNLQPEDSALIKEIIGKIVLMLNFIKNCEQNKILKHAEKAIIHFIEKTKQICLFSLDNSLISEFDTYQNFIRNVIFYSDSQGNQINLLELIDYFIKTVYEDLVMSDLIRFIFTLLRMEVPFEQLERFEIITTIFEQVIEMMNDKVVTVGIKSTIVDFLEKFFFYEKSSNNCIGSCFRIQHILSRKIHHIEEFMYSNNCISDIFGRTERLVNFVHKIKINQQNH